jgi:sec-independent protein translocase protein TatC
MTLLPGRRRGRARRTEDEGRMSLVEHLRELRNRMFTAAIAIVLGMALAWIFYDPLFALLKDPFDGLRADAESRGLDVTLALTDVTGPFFLQLKISLVAGIVLSSPVWLYQIWAFVTPGLHKSERRYTLAFLATAIPLFLAGCYLAYLILPKGLSLLIGFTPANEGVENLITLGNYLNFVIRMVLVFGLGFELPVFIVLLNLVGVLSYARLKSWRSGFWFGILVFAAVATPTGDPITMLILGVPIILLFEISLLIARLTDRRRRLASNEPDYATLGDDETSAL